MARLQDQSTVRGANKKPKVQKMNEITPVDQLCSCESKLALISSLDPQMALDASPWGNGTTAEEPLDLAAEMRLDTLLRDNSTNATEIAPAPEDDPTADIGRVGQRR